MQILILFIFLTSAMAQHSEQPIKEETSDLRDQEIIFSIEDVEAKVFWVLEKTLNHATFIRKIDKKNEVVRKIDSKLAQQMDRDFASRFLKCQYEIPSAEGKCLPTHRIMMRGERQEICQKDDKKSQEIKAFLEEMGQRF